MKNRQFWIFLVALISVCIFILIQVYMQAHTPKFDPIADHSSKRTNQWGTKALRTLYQKLGQKPATWAYSWTKLSPQVKTLWVINPQEALYAEEIPALLSWVKAGGCLLFAPDPRLESEGVSRTGNQTAPDIALLHALGWQAVQAKLTGADISVSLIPELSDVRQLKSPANWRLAPTGSNTEVHSRLEQAGLSPGMARSLVETPIKAEWQILAEDSTGAMLTQAQVGKGKILLFADANMLGNKNIAQGDISILAVNYVAMQKINTIWFDEFIHGEKASETSQLDAFAFKTALWAIILAFGVFFAGKALRFGRPIPIVEPLRRSATTPVVAFAGLYRKAGKREAVLSMSLNRFKHKLASLAAVPLSTPNTELVSIIAQHKPKISTERILSILSQAEDAVSNTNLSDAQLLNITRRLAAVEQELFNDDK